MPEDRTCRRSSSRARRCASNSRRAASRRRPLSSPAARPLAQTAACSPATAAWSAARYGESELMTRNPGRPPAVRRRAGPHWPRSGTGRAPARDPGRRRRRSRAGTEPALCLGERAQGDRPRGGGPLELALEVRAEDAPHRDRRAQCPPPRLADPDGDDGPANFGATRARCASWWATNGWRSAASPDWSRSPSDRRRPAPPPTQRLRREGASGSLGATGTGRWAGQAPRTRTCSRPVRRLRR